MNDLISRQDAIDKIHEVYEYEFPAASGAFDEFVTMIIPTLLKNLPSVEPERKWIPCNARMPKEEKRCYWICTDAGYQCQCRWTNDVYGLGASDRWGWKMFDIPQHQEVVAWMPLPERYGKAGNDRN